MLATILFVVVIVVFLAGLGRSTMPRSERLPWMRWSARDLLGNVLLGVRWLLELDDRHPRRNTPFHR